jgi:hypothetical protein
MILTSLSSLRESHFDRNGKESTEGGYLSVLASPIGDYVFVALATCLIRQSLFSFVAKQPHNKR